MARRRVGVTRRQVLRSLTRLGLAGAVTHRAARVGAQRSARPPNIVFILSDNHRWDAMSSMQHPFVRTPHMDRLGREGVHFVNAFCTTPLCSPARASFLTGRYAYQHRVLNNTTQSSWDERHVTLLEPLKRLGYATAFIGKWHMPASGLPRLRGVDHFVTFTFHQSQGRYFDCPLMVDGREEPSRVPYLTEELTDRALEFIAQQRSRPFCLYLSHKAAHYPWQPPPDLDGLYAGTPVPLPPGANAWTGFVNGQIWGGFTRPIPSAYRSYMETITGLDREVGRVLDRLDELGLAEDTLVAYASDNGFLLGEHGRVELRWPFEEVLRVPLLVRYPRGITAPGRRATQMALNIDVAPTLLALAGGEMPADIQGRSLVPVLSNPAATTHRAWLAENYPEFPYRTPPYQGVRTERYLYVEYAHGFAPSLHDIMRDPTQQTNLIGTAEAEAVLPELRELLAGLRRGERFDG